jgi:hypothetical protein
MLKEIAYRNFLIISIRLSIRCLGSMTHKATEQSSNENKNNWTSNTVSHDHVNGYVNGDIGPTIKIRFTRCFIALRTTI